jgi:hypothetical protein
MSTAQVAEGDVQIVFNNEHVVFGHAYTAYCLACDIGHGFGWHGTPHIVGYESAPNAAALDDAWEHDHVNHPEVQEVSR